jgi:NADH dehydrogenase [ubiquinone] 1 alpha subcomplex assembly factor 5
MSASPPHSPDQVGPPRVFDRRRHARRLDRAARGFAAYSFLKRAVAEDIAERLAGVARRFDDVLDLGAHDGSVGRLITTSPLLADRIGRVVASNPSQTFAAQAGGIVADEEALPFAPGSFDLVVSGLSLHWVNDLPGTLIQIREALRPDGLFIGVLLGGRTLHELRQCLVEAEAELTGGAAPRISPFLDVQDGARLLQRAGFAMPVADSDTRLVRYRDPWRLLSDLKGMGETAAFASPSPPLPRAALMRAMELYQDRFSDPDGRVRATFEWVALTAWSPGPGQPQAKRPGSATVRLADALGVREHPAGEKTGR